MTDDQNSFKMAFNQTSRPFPGLPNTNLNQQPEPLQSRETNLQQPPSHHGTNGPFITKHKPNAINQGINGFIPSTSAISGRMQLPTNLNQPIQPSSATQNVQQSPLDSNVTSNINVNYPQIPGGSQLVGSPRSIPTRPYLHQQMSSSATPTQVSGNLGAIRQPNVSYPQESVTSPMSTSIPLSKRRMYPSQAPPGMERSDQTPSIPQSQHYAQLVQSPNSALLNQSYTQQPIPPGQNIPNQNAYQKLPQPNINETNQLMGRLTVEQSSTYPISLLEQKLIIPPQPLPPPKPPMSQEMLKKNARPEVMRCTLNAVPQTSSLLKQSKLPFGIYIHPFNEDGNTPIISSVITRCRSCRSYLNPFVSILDHKRWQCNICFRINDLPEELSYDYSSRQYIDVRKRPELTNASIEFIAPTEYMLRPPQPSVFVFVLDVSFTALNTGYLQHACQQISQNIGNLPGDSRTMIGFITFNSNIQFYSLKASQNQPQMFVVTDLDDIYLPAPDGLLVNVKENKEMILQLLESLPTSFSRNHDSNTCTGAAMLAAKQLVSSIGGRITVFQTCIPSVGPGRLEHREISNMTANSKDVQNLNPSTDFYKKLALECAGEQIAVDLFLLTGQYCDIASLSCVSRYSSGAIHFFPEFHASKNPAMLEKFCADLKRYLTRNIGFEAVMRLRCSKGLSIHAFHGNFFVRSTDLLSLPNVNPDQSFGMQIAIEDSLAESNSVGFQAALLYTNTKGERRIRVHTLSLPVTSKLSDVYAYADEEAIIVTLSKLAVDRTLMSSLGDAREAMMNACIDCLRVYRTEVANQRHSQAVLIAHNLRLLPLHILALLKNEAFKLGSGVTLDARVFALLEHKWQLWQDLMLKVYPRLYSILDFADEQHSNDPAAPIEPCILQASAEILSRQGIYLMDSGSVLYLFVGRNVSQENIQDLFHVENFNALPEKLNRLPELQTKLNIRTRKFVEKLRSTRPFFAILEVIREDTKNRLLFLDNLIDDRTESSMSYLEFLQHVQRQLNG